MSEEARNFRIGLFVLIAAALFVALLLTFGAGRAFQPRIFLETYMSSSVAGVDKGAPVRFRGVTIGKVADVTFVFNEYPQEMKSQAYNYVILVLEITEAVFPGMFQAEDLRATVARAAEAGLRARIEPQGITGLNYIELDFLDPALFPALPVEWTPRNYYVPSAPGQLQGILDSVNKITRDLEKLNVAELEKSLRELLDNLNTTLRVIEPAKLSADIRSLAQSSTALVQDVQKVLDSAEIPALAAETRSALATVQQAVLELNRILGNLEPATRLNSDDIHATLANLRVISSNLRELTAELRANPSRLIFSGDPPRPSVFRAKSRRAPRNQRNDLTEQVDSFGEQSPENSSAPPPSTGPTRPPRE